MCRYLLDGVCLGGACPIPFWLCIEWKFVDCAQFLVFLLIFVDFGYFGRVKVYKFDVGANSKLLSHNPSQK